MGSMSRPQSTYPYQQAGRRPADHPSGDSYPGQEAADQDPPGRYPGSGGRAPRSSRKKALIATVVTAVVGGSVLGLAGAEWYSSRESEPKPAAVMSLTEIAAQIGCKPADLHKNSEFQQAACTVGGTRMTILTFISNQKMTDWIGEAEGYGGAYLVGAQWLVTSTKAETLDPLVDKLGGQIMLDSAYVDN